MKRSLLLAFLIVAVWTAENWWLSTSQSNLATTLAMNQFPGDFRSAEALRSFQALKDLLPWGCAFLSISLCLIILGPPVHDAYDRFKARNSGLRVFKHSNPLILAMLLLVLTSTSGCIKSYDRPEYLEIDTSETGFLIPLEGDGTQQARFQSEDYLKQRKVAAKRVQITHRWSQEGRLPNEGRWIPTVRLVKVIRSPITRNWTSGNGAAREAQNRPNHEDKAIWIESGDSVGFSMGFTCTSFISEDDAARFLYWYPSGSLQEVMDHEVRARIQQVAAEVAAKYPLDSLRSKKQEISDAVKRDLTNFFALRGITVTTVGMFGGMTYENPAIQRAIDETFISQQLKVVAEAKFEAQKTENDRIQLEANGSAEKARREALGLADARTTTAKAEAAAIREISNATREAQNNPLLLQLRAIEVEKARVEKWDGKYPQWWMASAGEHGAPSFQFQIPSPTAAK